MTSRYSKCTLAKDIEHRLLDRTTQTLEENAWSAMDGREPKSEEVRKQERTALADWRIFMIYHGDEQDHLAASAQA